MKSPALWPAQVFCPAPFKTVCTSSLPCTRRSVPCPHRCGCVGAPLASSLAAKKSFCARRVVQAHLRPARPPAATRSGCMMRKSDQVAPCSDDDLCNVRDRRARARRALPISAPLSSPPPSPPPPPPAPSPPPPSALAMSACLPEAAARHPLSLAFGAGDGGLFAAMGATAPSDELPLRHGSTSTRARAAAGQGGQVSL